MTTTITDLLTVLDEETACYQEMKRILVDEETTLAPSQKNRFDRVQREKGTLLLKLEQHEQKRRHLIDHLAVDYPVDPSAVTVSSLARHLPAPVNAQLLSRADDLRSCMADVQLKNNRNQQLIHHYLDLTKSALKLLTGQVADNLVYQKPGSDPVAAGYRSGGGRIFCGNG